VPGPSTVMLVVVAPATVVYLPQAPSEPLPVTVRSGSVTEGYFAGRAVEPL
jgi:hypothetical protein